MATTAKRKIKRGLTKKDARQAARSALKAWLAQLPGELAADLEKLFALVAKAETAQERNEIAATITELLYPDTLNVRLDKYDRWGIDDPAARKRLTDYRRNIGKQIEKFRKAKGMSQIQLGRAAGISQSHVCRLETGVHIPTHVTIENIAQVLGVCPSQIDPGFESTLNADE